MKLDSNRLWRYTIIALSILFVTCNSTVQEEVIPGEKLDAEARFGNPSLKFPELTIQARAKVAAWSVFEDFKSELATVNGRTIAELKPKTERLELQTDSLIKKIPNELYTNPISSRLIVLNSRIKLLNQEINKATIDSLAVVDKLNELNIAATNFLLQINEKLQKDIIDLQRINDEKKELEKQKQFLDSVYQVERRDNNIR